MRNLQARRAAAGEPDDSAKIGAMRSAGVTASAAISSVEGVPDPGRLDQACALFFILPTLGLTGQATIASAG